MVQDITMGIGKFLTQIPNSQRNIEERGSVRDVGLLDMGGKNV